MTVVKAKNDILQGARAYAHERDLDFTFVYIVVCSKVKPIDILLFTMIFLYFQYRSATLFSSLLWSVAEKGREEEESHHCKIKMSQILDTFYYLCKAICALIE